MGDLVKKGLLSLFLVITLEIAGCQSSDDDSAATPENSDAEQTEATDGEEKAEGEVATGGTLNIAIDAPPPTLDWPSNPATATRDTAKHIYETLLTTTESFEVAPMLAESVETDDNQTYTFKLREGIKFHNGKEMTSEDVVASMERWLEQSTITGNIFIDATWTAEDDYTVVLELKEPSSLTLDTLASAKQAAAIMPKEVIEAADEQGPEEYIGTGPFEFVEWKQDQYLKFKKFADYQPREDDADGLSGKREALVDEIIFHMVPDTSTRIAGLQTGEYDIALGMPYDNYDQFDNDPNFETFLTPSANEFVGFNNVSGIASDFAMREAINVGIDYDEIMMAAFPNKEFYWLDAGYMDKHIENWASTAGSEYHNINDPERAKEMLDEMGYDGEEFVVMTTRDYDHHYNVGVVFHDQLKQLGINAVLDVYDWPTMVDNTQNNLDVWDVYVASTSTVSTPPQLITLSPTWAGGVNNDHVVETIENIEKAPTIEEAQQMWHNLQQYVWEEVVPTINLGGYHSFFAASAKVSGITTNSGPIFWNVSKSE